MPASPATRSDETGPRLWWLALVATIDLAVARAALMRIRPDGVVARNRAGARAASAQHDPAALVRSCDEAAFFIARMAARVPWRADCLVQALAGQRWLARRRIAGTIVIGAAKTPGGMLDAHAWLKVGERIVLGGDIARFQPLLEPDPEGSPEA